MKIVHIFFTGIILTIAKVDVSAQPYWNNTGGTSATVSTTTPGSCVIGNTLSVQGNLIDMTTGPGGGDPWKAIIGGSYYSGLGMYAHTATTDGSGIELYSQNAYSWGRQGRINYYSYGDPAPSLPTTLDYHAHVFYNYNPTTLNHDAYMSITHDGHIIMGGGLINTSSFTSPISSNYLLSVDGNTNIRGGLLDMAMPGDASFRGITGSSNNFGIGLMSNTNTTNGSGIDLYGPTSVRPGAIYYSCYGSSSSSSYQHLFLNYDQSLPANNYTALMGIQGNGTVVIGQSLIWPTGTVPPTPPGYLLYVAQGILTEKLKVANSTDAINWSDFVFNTDYNLMPLSKVESYVNKNKHLPEIPSASEVAKDGIDVASMDAKLLQKIEELTLYIIQQQKEIEELKKNINH